MSHPTFSLIAAVHDDTWAIAVDGGMPWDRPDDLARFQKLTTNDTILMGRKTWETLPVQPLPDRRNVVLSRNEEFAESNRNTHVIVVSSKTAAPRAVQPYKRVWIMGGAEIYKQFAPYVDDMHITWVWEREGEDFGASEGNRIELPRNVRNLKKYAFKTEERDIRDGFAFEHAVR